MSRTLHALLTFLLLAVGPSPSSAQALAIPVEGGGQLQADLLLPPGAGKVAALIVAPGQGYHRNLPLTQGIAIAAPENGWASLRFDWRYFTADSKQGKPAPDLSAERTDLGAAIAYLRAHPRVDPERIVVVGKSLGSIVVAQVFAKDAALKAAMLLTPVCREPAETPKYYGRSAGDKRPVVMILGDADSVCPLANLQEWARGEKTAVPVVTLPGNHGFHVESATSSARNDRNVQQAVAVTVQWVREILERKP